MHEPYMCLSVQAIDGANADEVGAVDVNDSIMCKGERERERGRERERENMREKAEV